MKFFFRVFLIASFFLMIPFLCQAATTVLTDTSPNVIITSGSSDYIYGTADANHITIESSAYAELLNFPGNNTITIQSDSILFTVSRSGATVTFEGSDGTILKIPSTSSTQAIVFNDTNLTFVINHEQVMLGSQVITAIKSPISKDGDTSDSQQYCQDIPNETELRMLLEHWRNEISPSVSKEATQVKTFADSFPLEEPSNTLPIGFDYVDQNEKVDVDIVIHRRDWAYAIKGFAYTLWGGTTNLSFGLPGDLVSAKFHYNFDTGAFGSGVGAGLNLGKLISPFAGAIFKNTLKFEFFAVIDSETGPKVGIETGLNPRIGFAEAKPGDLTYKIDIISLLN